MIALADPEPSIGDRIEELVQIVSASRLNTFHTCRLKFFFRYVQELTKPMTAALFVGKAVHAALQAWSNRRWRGESYDLDALKPAFLENWAKAQDEEPVRWQEDQEKDQQDKAWGLVELYLRETPVPAEEKPEAVEVTVEADLSQHGLPTLVGVIDLVRPGGSIVDFKTSSCAPQSRQILHRHETQLTGYSLLYREATGLRESGLELHHLVKTKVPKLIVSTFGSATETQKTRLFRSMESYVDGVQAEDFVPSPGMHCVSCEFFRECSVWKGGAA